MRASWILRREAWRGFNEAALLEIVHSWHTKYFANLPGQEQLHGRQLLSSCLYRPTMLGP